MIQPAPIMQVENLEVKFPTRSGLFSRISGYVRAVDDVSFEIAPGETLGLVGESGCGKTTTGRALSRLIEPTGGRVLFDGRNMAHAEGPRLKRLRKDLQIVFQDPYSSLNPRMTVQSIIEEGLVIHRQGTRADRQEKVVQTMRQVGLDPSYRNRYPHEFSGGQRQRISIARALAVGPRFIVLDEPISALDVSIQSQIINLLTDLKERLGLTYLFISHDLSVVEYISERVAVMYLGQIVETGASGEVYRRPLHPYTHALLSSIPTLEPKRKKNRIVLPGDVPSPSRPPSGCRFHPRCPLAMTVCRDKVPVEVSLEGHKVRCHAVSEALEKSGPDAAKISADIASRMGASAAISPVG